MFSASRNRDTMLYAAIVVTSFYDLAFVQILPYYIEQRARYPDVSRNAVRQRQRRSLHGVETTCGGPVIQMLQLLRCDALLERDRRVLLGFIGVRR